MQLTLTQHGMTVTLNVDEDDLTLPQVVELLVRPALRAAGYLDKTIENAIGAVDEAALDQFYGLDPNPIPPAELRRVFGLDD